MIKFTELTYISIFKTILPYLILSLICTYILIILKKQKLFYLLIGIELIIIFFVQYSTISFSVITFMESKEFIIILNMLVIIGIYLVIPLSSILLKTILKKFQ